MLSNRPPGKGLLSEPFSWIILGAALVFASSILSGALGIVYVFAEFNPTATFPGDLLLAVSLGLGFLSPVGSFLLLVGLARAVHRPFFPATESLAHEGQGAGVADLAQPANPYRIALLGAVLALIGGLAAISASLARYLFPPAWAYTGIQGYLQTWALVALLTGAVAAVGSLLAFVGVGLMIRNASRRAERV